MTKSYRGASEIMAKTGNAMIRGFIIGASLVGILWANQWHSLRNQEISHYIEAGPLLPTDFYTPEEQ